MKIKTAIGEWLDLDFEPLISLSKNPSNYTQHIIDQVNMGIYDSSIRGGIIIDAGANVGLFSIYASCVAEKIYAIEPTMQHYNDMLKIIDKLQLKNVIPINAALWKENGVFNFNLVDYNTTMNAITSNPTSVTVSCFNLPTFFEKYKIDRVDYFKCDIEGAEIDIINDESFAKVVSKIDFLFVEVHANAILRSTEEATNYVQNRLTTLFPVVLRVGVDRIYAHG
jgi:FkbM family methyltransferase